MTDLEKESLEVIIQTLTFLSVPKASPYDYREIMGKLRDTKKRLENKQYGCLSGRHMGECFCTDTLIKGRKQ